MHRVVVTRTSRHSRSRATAEACPLLFGDVLFTLAAREPTVKQSRKVATHELPFLLLYSFISAPFFFFVQLSSQRSTSIKIWSMSTASWTSAFSPGWRWAPVCSRHTSSMSRRTGRLREGERCWGGRWSLGPNGASTEARSGARLLNASQNGPLFQSSLMGIASESGCVHWLVNAVSVFLLIPEVLGV